MPENTEVAPSQVPAKSSDQNLMAAISYLWIVSIIILLIRKDNEYVQFHAKQGTVLFAIWAILSVIGMTLWFLSPVIAIINLVILVAVILGFIKAYSGERYRLPLVADLADKIKI